MPDPVPNPTAPQPRNDLFSDADSLRDLHALIAAARGRGAAKLLVLAGKPVVCRINGQLSEPLAPGRVHFNQTERLVAALLSPEQHAELDRDGAVEIDYQPDQAEDVAGSDGQSAAPVRINVFFGDGAHNLVVFLE